MNHYFYDIFTVKCKKSGPISTFFVSVYEPAANSLGVTPVDNRQIRHYILLHIAHTGG